MENYNKELEKNLLEMIKEKEKTDRRMMKIEVVLSIFSLIILFVPIFVGAYAPMEDWQRTICVFSGFIPAIIGFAFALRIEQTAGYYECQKCSHKYVPTYKAVVMAPHMGSTRHMRCPKCKQKSWQKKVISKD